MTVADVAVAGPNWRLAANGAVSPVEPLDLSLHAQWTSHVDGATREGMFTIAGDSRSLDFDASMQAPFGLRSSGQVKSTPQGYEIAATGAWRDLGWPLFAPPSIRSPAGRFELGGALDDLSVSLDVELAAERLPSTRLTVQGTGSVEPSAKFPFDLTARWQAVTGSDTAMSGELAASGDREHAVVRSRVLAPFSASAEAALVLGGEPSFDAVAQWSGLVWPLAGTPLVASRKGPARGEGIARADGARPVRGAGGAGTNARWAPERDGHGRRSRRA